ncbi:hypothetical protein B0T16DRAFT_430841 [Cercophora newfieldiana]|uniref:Uncharacterized protein n=1 Tax=Cercophora newfieldiana TaxID=92897 RepID=A0AA39XVF0_9PEZI|nr:hypothetical protein B0T16DRAFT_430841 [Cercophora newfieldiana]
MRETFLSNNTMDGSYPGCSLAQFQRPLLLQCPYNISSVTFTGRVNSTPKPYRSTAELDGGLDGYNWKICLEKGGPTLVLKLFWDPQAPEPPHYFAAQRECQNVALFQMLEAAVSEDKAGLGPILVNPAPADGKEAEANLLAFSNEGRAQSATLPSTEGFVRITSVPRMRQCLGWMRFTGEELLARLPTRLHPPPIKVGRVERSISKHATYFAVVYEYVEEGLNDPDVVQEVLDFLWCVGFGHVPVTKVENWESGVLLDHSDIVHCNGAGWDARFFGYRTASQILH